MQNNNDNLLLFKNLLIEMAVRVATLEKVLLDKDLISLDDLSSADEKLNKEITNIINEK
jgi:hypothetical protein